jgi:2-dehydro-3-deoxyphosphogluconate aldolase/(4S)-4-hydroxy-2-oxoglutarate aldolase
MPTGGIHLENAADYIKAGALAVGVGSDLVDSRAILEEDWSTLSTTVTGRAREYVRIVHEARAATAS